MPAGEQTEGFGQAKIQSFDDAFEVVADEVWMHRKRENRISDLFARRKIPAPITVASKSRLEMKWHRVMDAALNTVKEERVAQSIASIASDNVAMVTGLVGNGDSEPHNTAAAVLEKLIVSDGEFATARISGFESRQFGTQHGGLQGIEPRVVTALLVSVVRDAAVVTQRRDASCEIVIISSHGTGIAPGTKILIRVEAEATRRTNRTSTSSTAANHCARTMGLAGILDDPETIGLRHCEQLLHGRRNTVQMGGHDRFRTVDGTEPGALEIITGSINADTACCGVDIDERRSRAKLYDRFRDT